LGEQASTRAHMAAVSPLAVERMRTGGSICYWLISNFIYFL
jgi:hypothetical protein